MHSFANLKFVNDIDYWMTLVKEAFEANQPPKIKILLHFHMEKSRGAELRVNMLAFYSDAEFYGIVLVKLGCYIIKMYW